MYCNLNSFFIALQWRHNEHDGVSNRQPHHCLLKRLFRRGSKKASKLRVTGLCEGNSPVTGEFPTQMASYAENVSIWWRHHSLPTLLHLDPGTYHVTVLQFLSLITPWLLRQWSKSQSCRKFYECVKKWQYKLVKNRNKITSFLYGLVSMHVACHHSARHKSW